MYLWIAKLEIMFYVDVENLDDSIDKGLFGTKVQNAVSGYQWNNPHPNMVIRKIIMCKCGCNSCEN